MLSLVEVGATTYNSDEYSRYYHHYVRTGFSSCNYWSINANSANKPTLCVSSKFNNIWCNICLCNRKRGTTAKIRPPARREGGMMALEGVYSQLDSDQALLVLIKQHKTCSCPAACESVDNEEYFFLSNTQECILSTNRSRSKLILSLTCQMECTGTASGSCLQQPMTIGTGLNWEIIIWEQQ